MEILEAFFAKQQDMAGKKVVITAGPTYEKIDPVRFIGNYSSGKMGIRTCRGMRFTWSGSIANQRTGNDSGPSP